MALGSGSTVTAANQVNVGGRTVSGVAAGAVTATSTDAVNGSQLYTVQQQVAANTAAIAAITSFDPTVIQGQIDTLGNRINTLDDRIDVLDNRVSAGTALAIAMGGASFLPGKNISLNGNVGAYRGAFAGAVNLGALVNESVAVNAGVATNFNKGGSKIGARVGFTVGF